MAATGLRRKTKTAAMTGSVVSPGMGKMPPDTPNAMASAMLLGEAARGVHGHAPTSVSLRVSRRQRRQDNPADAPPDLSSFTTGALTFCSKNALILQASVAVVAVTEGVALGVGRSRRSRRFFANEHGSDKSTTWHLI